MPSMTVAVSGHPEIRRYEGPKGGVQKTVGSNEELIGPFRDYEAAKEEWAKHAWQSVGAAGHSP